MKPVWLFMALGATITGMAMANPPKASGVPATSATPDDQYLWLEDIHGTKSMDWVHAQNAVTQKAFMESLEFDKTRGEILEVLDSEARIPIVHRRGDYLYNFWQDKAHPRGVWRRTTMAEFEKADPKWETVLDIDALNQAEGKKWVFKGAECMKPDYVHCLVSLSPGGGDAVEVREFDLPSKSFVKDGFFLPVAKTEVGWIDANHVYVGTDFGPGSMTKSSYPRIVKEWTRGTPLSSAKLVYEGKPDDLTVGASYDRTKGFERDYVGVQQDFYHREIFLRKDGHLAKLDLPSDADFSTDR
ncbi:MAG: S9 family peptidase, partial [Rhodanobacteraceae bacterium]